MALVKRLQLPRLGTAHRKTFEVPLGQSVKNNKQHLKTSWGQKWKVKLKHWYLMLLLRMTNWKLSLKQWQQCRKDCRSMQHRGAGINGVQSHGKYLDSVAFAEPFMNIHPETRMAVVSSDARHHSTSSSLRCELQVSPLCLLKVQQKVNRSFPEDWGSGFSGRGLETSW